MEKEGIVNSSGERGEGMRERMRGMSSIDA
jgi:hypothetical protein